MSGHPWPPTGLPDSHVKALIEDARALRKALESRNSR
jgi:hypothetical protein